MPPPALVTTYHAGTFAERGLAAPFTSPTLGGARLRKVRRMPGGPPPRCCVEALVPNPSGARGMYVVPWTDVRALFRPTVHDIRLGDALALAVQLGDELRPSTVRRIAREVAQDGFAGRAAAAAAIVAGRIATARIQDSTTFFLNVLDGSTQQGGAGPTGSAQAAARAQGIAMLAQRLRRPQAALVAALHRISEISAAHGLAPERADGPVAECLTEMRAVFDEMSAAMQGEPDIASAGAAATLAAGAPVLKLAVRARAALAGELTAVPELLCAMIDTPEACVAALERAEWLLDGWRQLCLVWRAAEGAHGRVAAAAEMGESVPVLPDEAEEWFGLPAGAPAQINSLRKPGTSRGVSQPRLDQIARNEQLRALAA